MKRTTLLIILLIIAALATACAPAAPATEEAVNSLTVSDADNQQTISLEAIQELPQTTANFQDIDYVGVTLPTLLEDAGISLDDVTAIKAVASDGYSVNYEPALYTREDVILAYAQADGPLAEDDGALRMVVPGERGQMNVRMVVEIEVVR